MANLSDLNRQVRCLAAAEVDGVGALMVPEPDPGAGPEAAAQAPWNEMKNKKCIQQQKQNHQYHA